MAFTVAATPDSFVLESGQSQDVVFTFTGVGDDATAQATETFALAAEQVVAALTLTLIAADPQLVDHSVPVGVSRTLLSIDDSQAVIRYARA